MSMESPQTSAEIALAALQGRLARLRLGSDNDHDLPLEESDDRQKLVCEISAAVMGSMQHELAKFRMTNIVKLQDDIRMLEHGLETVRLKKAASSKPQFPRELVNVIAESVVQEFDHFRKGEFGRLRSEFKKLKEFCEIRAVNVDHNGLAENEKTVSQAKFAQLVHRLNESSAAVVNLQRSFKQERVERIRTTDRVDAVCDGFEERLELERIQWKEIVNKKFVELHEGHDGLSCRIAELAETVGTWKELRSDVIEKMDRMCQEMASFCCSINAPKKPLTILAPKVAVDKRSDELGEQASSVEAFRVDCAELHGFPGSCTNEITEGLHAMQDKFVPGGEHDLSHPSDMFRNMFKLSNASHLAGNQVSEITNRYNAKGDELAAVVDDFRPAACQSCTSSSKPVDAIVSDVPTEIATVSDLEVTDVARHYQAIVESRSSQCRFPWAVKDMGIV